jgi:tRNA dimethylallyltransferase
VGEAVAARLGGAVVCADARQVYRELERGTGKPTPAERAARPHHLFDLWSLGERASAGGWARAAAETCERLFTLGVPPVLVGGSGLYLAALERGLHPEPPRDEALRVAFGEEWEALGATALHARLAALDPEAAAALRPRDRQRVLRALEIVTLSGRTLGWWRERPPAPPLEAEWRTFELTVPPARLDERIAERARAMWAAGLPDEVRGLVEAGAGGALRELSAIGYDESLAVLEGALGEAEALARMTLRTRQLAKRQRTWFRHQMAREPLAHEPERVEELAARIAGAWRGGSARG